MQIHNQSPNVRVQSLPSSQSELNVWQTGAFIIVDRIFKTTFARGLSYGPSKGLSKNDRIKETQGAYG